MGGIFYKKNEVSLQPFTTTDGFKREKPHNSLSYKAFISSGWQDSNLRPPAPKAGAMTGLRYTPNCSFHNSFFIFKRHYC